LLKMSCRLARVLPTRSCSSSTSSNFCSTHDRFQNSSAERAHTVHRLRPAFSRPCTAAEPRPVAQALHSAKLQLATMHSALHVLLLLLLLLTCIVPRSTSTTLTVSPCSLSQSNDTWAFGNHEGTAQQGTQKIAPAECRHQ
jgi:hypothetical protein